MRNSVIHVHGVFDKAFQFSQVVLRIYLFGKTVNIIKEGVSTVNSVLNGRPKRRPKIGFQD